MRLTTKGLLLIAIPAFFELALLSGLVKAQSDAAQAERWAIHSEDVLRQTTAILDPVLGESVALRGAVVAVSVSGLASSPKTLVRTDVMGNVTVTSPNYKRGTRGTITFTVTSVTSTTHKYVPADNDCLAYLSVTR
jgi:hypothetical protein